MCVFDWTSPNNNGIPFIASWREAWVWTRVQFSPRTHKLCSLEILKATGNLKEYKPNFKKHQMNIVFKVHLKFYKWKISTIQQYLEMLEG